MRIRPMTRDDAAAVATLCDELGYRTTRPQVEERLNALSTMADAAFVAADGDAISGWVHVHVSRTITSEPRTEILGLVVSKSARRGGVGRALVAHVEEWARDRGITDVRVRCSVARADAHEFYRALGYRTSKRQEVFDKSL